MAIDYLTKLLVPPSKPLETPSLNAWFEVETRLGVALPDDYKEFVEIYGSGQIGKFLWIFNPFSANENLNLERQIDRQSQVLIELQSYGEVVPYKSFPEVGGIFPFGITDNGDVLFWRTAGNSNYWPVVVNEARSPEWESFNFPMCRFLESILSRQLVCNIFPRNFPGASPQFEACP